MKSNLLWIWVVAGLIALVAIYFFAKNSYQSSNAQIGSLPSPSLSPQAMTEVEGSPSAQVEATSAAMEEGVKSFTVTGSNFKFEPSTITVNKGDKVRITFQNSQGMHNLVLDEFGANTMKPFRSGSSSSIEFTADKTGTFEYYCSVASHRQLGMVGKLIVQ